MTITQERFLEQFTQRLINKGFCREIYDHSVVLKKRMTISDGIICNVHLSWLPKSWPVVKVQIRIGSILLPYDVTVGLMMDYKGGPDEILSHIVKQALSGFADIIIKQL